MILTTYGFRTQESVSRSQSCSLAAKVCQFGQKKIHYMYRIHRYMGSLAQEEGVQEGLHSLLALLIPFINHKLDYQKLSCHIGGLFCKTHVKHHNHVPKIPQNRVHTWKMKILVVAAKTKNGVSAKEQRQSKDDSRSNTTLVHMSLICDIDKLSLSEPIFMTPDPSEGHGKHVYLPTYDSGTVLCAL